MWRGNALRVHRYARPAQQNQRQVEGPHDRKHKELPEFTESVTSYCAGSFPARFNHRKDVIRRFGYKSAGTLVIATPHRPK
jgi:hypothetical protein